MLIRRHGGNKLGPSRHPETLQPKRTGKGILSGPGTEMRQVAGQGTLGKMLRKQGGSDY
jgi:hypothetical protein